MARQCTQVQGPREEVNPYSCLSVSYSFGWNGSYKGAPRAVCSKVEDRVDPHIGGPALPYIVEGQVTGNKTLIWDKTHLSLVGGVDK